MKVRYTILLLTATLLCSVPLRAQWLKPQQAVGIYEAEPAGAAIIGAKCEEHDFAWLLPKHDGLAPEKRVTSPDYNSYQRATTQPVRLQYFDESLPRINWVAPGIYTPYQNFAYGERMTTPGAGGYLDSVSFVLDSLGGDSITVTINSDTLYHTNVGWFHLINLFDGGYPYYSVNVAVDDIRPGVPFTVSVPHVAVPKEFFVVLRPYEIHSGKNYFYLQSDQEPRQIRRAEISRSAAVAVVNGNVFSFILDGTFYLDSSKPIYCNYYMTAFVDTTGTGGTRGVGVEPQGVAAVYPNPANSSLTFTASGSLSVYDLLGNEIVSTIVTPNSGTLDVSALPAGSYSYKLANEDSTTIGRFVKL